MNIAIALPLSFGIILIGLFLYWLYDWTKNNKPADQDSTRPMPEINPDIEIPQEDQEYLAPLMVQVLKHLAHSKKAYPTNAMLIEHLAETLSQAAGSFERRTEKEPTTQKKNRDWLYVAALAIRLYDEGTPHNSDETRERFMTSGSLASRELKFWAERINAEVIDKVKKKMNIDPAVQQVATHAETIAGSPYTADEVEDLKEAHDRSLMNRKNKK